MLNYVIEKLVPKLILEKVPADNEPISVTEFLQEEGYHNLNISTVTKWMNILGYKYCTRQKKYYNDKHEEPSNKEYQAHFIEHCLLGR